MSSFLIFDVNRFEVFGRNTYLVVCANADSARTLVVSDSVGTKIRVFDGKNLSTTIKTTADVYNRFVRIKIAWLLARHLLLPSFSL